MSPQQSALVTQVPSSVVLFDPPRHLVPRPPLWVETALRVSPSDALRIGTVDVVASSSLALLSTSIAGARAMSAEALRDHVADAYIAVGAALTAIERQPIRFWNFVPSPGDSMGDGLDRYMVFNSGRYRGYTQWLGGAERFGRTLPTASAVGVIGDDLVIACLAATARGIPVENPRQTPAWQYSHRYGPQPPCFSRATIATVNGRPLLLVGGTASIVGETSTHDGDVDAQVAETLRNLEALVAAATADPGGVAPLDRFRDLRVYVAREQDAGRIRGMVFDRCARADHIELAIARVCRPELLVEIEGVAEI